MARPPVQLPDELLELIADAVDSREDLLALALTCSDFCRIIIPERLYRSVTVSITNTDLLTRLSKTPRLVENVFSLTVVNTTILAPSNLQYGEPIPHLDWGKTTNIPLALLDQLKDALALCRNLHSLRLNSGLQDSFRMSEESVNSLLDPLVHRLRDVCLDITRFHTSPTLSLWKLKGLRTLELIISGLNRYDWNDLCAVLENSPYLETLSLPSISLPQNVPAPAVLPDLNRLPRLSFLKRLSTPVSFSDTVTELAFYDFLHANPTIEDLRWMSPYLPAASDMPALPHLRRIRPGTSGASFLQRFLENKPPRSVELESLECYRAIMHPLHLLEALDPTSLRALHMHDGVWTDIKALAHISPNIEELVLPHMPTYKMREPQGLVQRVRDSVTSTASNQRAYALLNEIVPLFPALRRICHVDVLTGDSSLNELLTKSIWWTQSHTFSPSPSTFNSISTALQSIHKLYPQLQNINGWKLEGGIDERVVLVKSVTGMQFLSMVAPKARFWLRRDGFGMGFVDPEDAESV